MLCAVNMQWFTRVCAISGNLLVVSAQSSQAFAQFVEEAVPSLERVESKLVTIQTFYKTQLTEQLSEQYMKLQEMFSETDENRRKTRKRQDAMARMEDKFDALLMHMQVASAKTNTSELTAMVAKKSLFSELPTDDESVFLKIVADTHRRYVQVQL